MLKNKFIYKGIILILAVFLALLLHKITFVRGRQSSVRIAANNFIKDGKPFRFIGANAVSIVFYDDWDLDVEKAIRSAKENNISVLRFYIDLGWGKDADFDRIFDIASKYGVYIILAFTDCCCSGDYPSLNKYFTVHAPFCNITNRQSVKAFKKLIKQIIERKNSVNGRIYRDDPAILAWEIANELEYWRFSESDVSKWINELAAYIKSLDKNHLVTIGINTGNPGFARTDFHRMFNTPALDFLSFHFYPPSENLNPARPIIRREDISQIKFITRKFLALNKPVIMSEFGFSNSTDLNFKFRDNPHTVNFYNLAFKKYMDAAFSAGASGVMFWGWGIPQERAVPMWWNREGHSSADKKFCAFLRRYRITNNK